MSPRPDPTDRELVRGVARLVKDGAAAGRAPGDGRERFIDAVAGAAAQRSRREPRALMVVLAAALLTVGLLSAWKFWPRRTLDYAVLGAHVAGGGFVQAPPNGEAVVRFSDGSDVTLAPGARGRVNEVRERGARFTVETGLAVVNVAKREGGADYVVEAGPYAVKVTGTRFSIGWDPGAERMHLDLSEGSVIITGPQAEAGIGLRAGQVIDLDPSGVRVTDPEAAAASTAEPAPQVTSSPGGTGNGAVTATSDPAVATSAPASGEPPSGQRASWAERVAAGDYEGVLADADTRGIDATLASASAGDLMSLADAARYGGRPGVAQGALTAVRTRFPGTRSASMAAFLLGRMAEDGGRVDAALSLYDATLSEGGTFASEALGRKMMIVKRRSGDAGARPIAEQYLKSYPRGAYADSARSLTAH